MNRAPAKRDSPGQRTALPGVRVSATSDPAELEPLWRLFETTAVCHVFQTHAFISAWCEHIARPRGIEPVFVTGTADDGRLLFLLPLGLKRRSGARTIEWLGGDQADYHGGLFDADYLARLSADKAAFDAFLKGAIGAVGGADLLHLTRMPAELQGTPNPFRHVQTYPNANGAHSTRLAPDWDSYYRAKRHSGWRRTDKSKERRLAELGEVSFVIADDAACVDAILKALFEQKRKGLARIGVDDMFAPAGVQDFYRKLAHDSIGGRGNVQLAALYCGDHVAAASYGFVFRDTYYYVLHSYSLDAFAEQSPGRQLMYRLMQWCFDNAVTTFDFTVGDEGYKDQWCETPLELLDAAVPLSGYGALTSGAFRLRELAKRQIKADRKLWSAAVSVRKALLSLRRS